MYILNRRRVTQEKMDRIQSGYSAYVESAELADLIKKEIQLLKLDVHEDITDFGFWFIPNRVRE
ncbi:hypothetical protein ACFFIX_02270 [Metabacillus herbersteinensis]|uniref:Uncharacterized protein n=1 Tax=Metabacillus herbersteinensis TaxID=283816 RepID=A0ABV6G9G3_9BACI